MIRVLTIEREYGSGAVEISFSGRHRSHGLSLRRRKQKRTNNRAGRCPSQLGNDKCRHVIDGNSRECSGESARQGNGGVGKRR